MTTVDERFRLGDVLLENMRREHASLAELLKRANGHWGYEDGVYRFYHQSMKVYQLQDYTQAIVRTLRGIAPEDRPFCAYFEQLIREGTGKEFTMGVNAVWVRETAPIVQAFLHALYFLQMAVKYGGSLEKMPDLLPSGMAGLLSLYDIR